MTATDRGTHAVAPTRAVVTGVGVVAPNGTDTAAYWSAVLAGMSGIGPITRFDPSGYPVRLAGEVTGFRSAGRVPSRLAVQTDRWTHMGFVAAEDALADSGVDTTALPEYEMALVTASSSGGTEFGQHEIEALWSRGSRFVGAYQSIAWFYAASTGQLSIRHGMRGPGYVIAAEEAGALDAFGIARRALRDGSRLVLCGGTDASLCPYGLVAQLSTGRLSEVADPARAYLPFDANATGYVPGEGGAMVVVENRTQAAARGAPQVYGEISGYAATFDPPPGSTRPPTLRRAIENALLDARLTPADIDVVFADAMGVPALDHSEAATIAAVFGPYRVPVTAPKATTGRLYAGNALDVVTALLALRHGLIPPTGGEVTLHPEYHIDLVQGQPRETTVRAALITARGFGGMNSALVVRAVD
jgi:act minimal PKS chain-length factor (CLF/KS beta)